jgi:hypothetical protein
MKIRLVPILVSTFVALAGLPGILDAEPTPEWQEVQPVAKQTDPLVFYFTGTINAQDVGLGTSEPFEMAYIFSPNLTPEPLTPNAVNYSPLSTVVLKVAGECARFNISATDPAVRGGITVFNDVQVVFGDRTILEDSYDVRVETSQEAPSPPLLFGREFSFARFLLIDERGKMLGDTSLPLSPDFAKAAQSYQLSVDLRDPSEDTVSLSGFGTTFKLKAMKKTEKLPC